MYTHIYIYIYTYIRAYIQVYMYIYIYIYDGLPVHSLRRTCLSATPNLPTNVIPTVLRLLDSNLPGNPLGPGNFTPYT